MQGASLRLIAATATILSVVLLSGCGLAPGGSFAEPDDGSTPSASQTETDSDNQDESNTDNEPTGVKGELIALGWECEDVSFDASVLDAAFNCTQNDDVIALSHFNDQAKVADYATNVSVTTHCKVHSDATEAYWATLDKWLLELAAPTDIVRHAISELDFALVKVGC